MKTKIELLELLLKELQTVRFSYYKGLCSLSFNTVDGFDEYLEIKKHLRENKPGLFTVLKLSNMWHYLINANNAYYYTPGAVKPRINYLKYLIKKEHAKQRRN
jgi:hypothetical protein